MEVTVRVISIILSIGIVFITSTAYAQDVPDSSSMLFDLFFLRPLGLAICALGISAAILSLPFTLGSPNLEIVGKRLVEEPLKFTFSRPLGQINFEGVEK